MRFILFLMILIPIISARFFYNENKSNATSIDPTVRPTQVPMDRRSNDKNLESKLDLLSSAVLSLNRKTALEKAKYHPLTTVMDEKHSNLFELMKWMSDYYYEDPVLSEHLA